MELRTVRAEDREAVIALVDAVYREYGDRVCLERADKDLADLPGSYAEGAFVVLDDAGSVRGSAAVLPAPDLPRVCVLRRFYLPAELRGAGWGRRLLKWTLDWAVRRGVERVELWSDTRFTRGHAFYERHGFRRGGMREMDDGWTPYREHFFSLELRAAGSM
ncbi:MAG: GNAT family N-acetyltransferase [Planctomycetota bacterium]